jgi:hypothetical protein
MIVTSVDDYPLVLMSIREGAAAREDLNTMFARYHDVSVKAIQRGTYHASICVSPGALTPTDRKHLAELTEKVPAAELERTVGSFVVVEQAVVRGALTAVRWLSPKFMIVEPVASVGEALDASKARLAQRGVEVSADALRNARSWLLEELRPRLAP